MRYESEIFCDGPYLHVLLPDVLPPTGRRFDGISGPNSRKGPPS